MSCSLSSIWGMKQALVGLFVIFVSALSIDLDNTVTGIYHEGARSHKKTRLPQAFLPETVDPTLAWSSGSTKLVVGEAREGKMLRSSAGVARSYGFTLLELLVVMVILGLLASYVGPKYFAQLGKSKTTVAKAQIEAFERSLDAFRIDVGRYPTSEEGLAALVARPGNASNWNGPYLRAQIPSDPWGRDYVYRSPGGQSEFDVISYGQDGQPGGTGEAADIVSAGAAREQSINVTGKTP